eukprot:scaffold163403_cov22-Cyclotella_meneghiniana.AAC.1
MCVLGDISRCSVDDDGDGDDDDNNNDDDINNNNNLKRSISNQDVQSYTLGRHYNQCPDGRAVRTCLNLGSYNYLGFADDWDITCKPQ